MVAFFKVLVVYLFIVFYLWKTIICACQLDQSQSTGIRVFGQTFVCYVSLKKPSGPDLGECVNTETCGELICPHPISLWFLDNGES